MNTGEIIKYFRLARNMTQEQLAQDAEISFSTLRKYEANERNPKYEQLSKIADALGISVNLFMDFEIQSVSDLFSILFKMEGQADLEIATSKDLAVLSEDALLTSCHKFPPSWRTIVGIYDQTCISFQLWCYHLFKPPYADIFCIQSHNFFEVSDVTSSAYLPHTSDSRFNSDSSPVM